MHPRTDRHLLVVAELQLVARQVGDQRDGVPGNAAGELDDAPPDVRRRVRQGPVDQCLRRLGWQRAKRQLGLGDDRPVERAGPVPERRTREHHGHRMVRAPLDEVGHELAGFRVRVLGVVDPHHRLRRRRDPLQQDGDRLQEEDVASRRITVLRIVGTWDGVVREHLVEHRQLAVQPGASWLRQAIQVRAQRRHDRRISDRSQCGKPTAGKHRHAGVESLQRGAHQCRFPAAR